MLFFLWPFRFLNTNLSYVLHNEIKLLAFMISEKTYYVFIPILSICIL